MRRRTGDEISRKVFGVLTIAAFKYNEVMKRNSSQPKKRHMKEPSRLKNPRREEKCENSRSLQMGNEPGVPGPRGACAPESTSQGSE